jgi:hypothetical protein
MRLHECSWHPRIFARDTRYHFIWTNHSVTWLLKNPKRLATTFVWTFKQAMRTILKNMLLIVTIGDLPLRAVSVNAGKRGTFEHRLLDWVYRWNRFEGGITAFAVVVSASLETRLAQESVAGIAITCLNGHQLTIDTSCGLQEQGVGPVVKFTEFGLDLSPVGK